MEIKDFGSVRLEVAIKAMKESLKVIKEFYTNGFMVMTKEDKSPVTQADITSDKVIRKILLSSFKDDGYLSEEEKDDPSRLMKEYVWIVDPLDGTEDFVHLDGMFCVNLALAYHHDLVLGLVGVPLTGEIFFAYKGRGAYLLTKENELKKLAVSKRKEKLIAVTSLFHTGKAEEDIYHNPLFSKIMRMGSSLKACAIASGEADVCLRLGEGTKEWDTAAPQLLVTEAGGVYLHPSFNQMIYNRKDVYNHEGYLIANDYTNLLKAFNK